MSRNKVDITKGIFAVIYQIEGDDIHFLRNQMIEDCEMENDDYTEQYFKSNFLSWMAIFEESYKKYPNLTPSVIQKCEDIIAFAKKLYEQDEPNLLDEKGWCFSDYIDTLDPTDFIPTYNDYPDEELDYAQFPHNDINCADCARQDWAFVTGRPLVN